MQQTNTTFNTRDKLKAIAVVSVFETGKPYGKFSTVAVLDDRAGISYGFSQFTHRSGSLATVLEKYLAFGGVVGREAIKDRMPMVRRLTANAIQDLASDKSFRNALRAAGITGEMRQAQVDVALERFLLPAERECARSGLTSPLALAVVYDSIVHGSWERLSKKVRVTPSGVTIASKDATHTFERLWITEYVHSRDQWLASVPRLAKTRYRTKFFLEQIELQNWELNLPLKPNGVAVTASAIDVIEKYIGGREVRPTESTAGQTLPETPQSSPVNSEQPSQTPRLPVQPSNIQAETRSRSSLESVSKVEGSGCLDLLENQVNAAATKYDQVERIATTVTTRNDAAKSLWTTVVGSITQTFWALVSLIAGIPREVWLVVAIIAAALMLMYLYRQITLGKIRESKSYAFRRDHPAELKRTSRVNA
jgi:chitosanase